MTFMRNHRSELKNDHMTRWKKLLADRPVTYFVLVRDAESNSFMAHETLTSLRFDAGKVSFERFNSIPFALSGTSITWSHNSEIGFTTGRLDLDPSSTSLHGSIWVGDTPDTAVQTHLYAHMVPLATYKTDCRGLKGELEIGLMPGQGFHCDPIIRCNGRDISAFAAFDLCDDSGKAVLIVDAPAPDAFDGTAVDAAILFETSDSANPTFDGHVIAWDGSTPTVESWSGTALPSRALADTMAEIDPDLSFDAALAAAPLIQGPQRSAAPANKVTGPSDLPVQDALTELLEHAPNDNEVNDTTFSYIIENMKVSMSRDTTSSDIKNQRKWLEQYFQETAPVITDEDRLKLIKASEGWFRDKFATTIFANQLAGQDISSRVLPRPLSDDDNAKLKRYLSESIPRQQDFLKQQSGMWRKAYIDNHADIPRYIEQDEKIRADRKAGRDTGPTWAERIVDHLAQPEEHQKLMDYLMNRQPSSFWATSKSAREIEEYIAELERVIADLEQQAKDDPASKQDYERSITTKTRQLKLYREKLKGSSDEKRQTAVLKMNRLTSLLQGLDSTGEAAEAYTTNINASALARMVDSVDIDAIPDFEEGLNAFMIDFLAALGKGDISQFHLDMSEEDLNQIRELSKHDTEETVELVKKMTSILKKSAGKDFTSKVDSASHAFDAQFPKMALFARFFLICAFVFTVVMVIVNLVKHSDSEDGLTLWERGQKYLAFGKLALETFKSVLTHVKAIGTTLKSFFKKGGSSSGSGSSFIPSWLKSATKTFIGWMKSAWKFVADGLKRFWHATKAGAQRLFKGLISSIRAAMNLFRAGVKRVISWVRDVSTKAFNTIRSALGELAGFVMRGLSVAATLYFTVTESITLMKALMTEPRVGAQILGSLQLVAVAVSGMATIIGIIAGSAAWSGAGLIIGLVAFGIGMLVSWLWPEDSPLQKLTDQVFRTFITSTVKPALDELDREAHPKFQHPGFASA